MDLFSNVYPHVLYRKRVLRFVFRFVLTFPLKIFIFSYFSTIYRLHGNSITYSCDLFTVFSRQRQRGFHFERGTRQRPRANVEVQVKHYFFFFHFDTFCFDRTLGNNVRNLIWIVIQYYFKNIFIIFVLLFENISTF